MAILNSTLLNYIYKCKCPQAGKIFAEVKPSIIKSLPIFDIDSDKQQPFVDKADLMLLNNTLLLELKNKFIQLLISKWSTLNITSKLDQWYHLTFENFRKEIEKQKIALSLSEQAEWLKYFSEQKLKAEQFKVIIMQTDEAIDALVYQLFELTDEEISIIENQTKKNRQS